MLRLISGKKCLSEIECENKRMNIGILNETVRSFGRRMSMPSV